MSADIGFDVGIRAAIATTRPDRRPAIGQISARANTLRRRARYRIAGVAAALVLGGVGVANALPTARHSTSLVVQGPRGKRRHNSGEHRATVPTTRPTVVPTTVSVVVPPGISGPNVSTPQTTTPTTVNVVTSPPTSPVTPTTPPIVYPPVTPGDVRLLFVLDDTGLHAPATFPASTGSGHPVEVLFDDRRTNHPAGEMLLSLVPVGASNPGSINAPVWTGDMAAPAASTFSTGTLQVYLYPGHRVPPPVPTVVITFVAPHS